MSLSNLTLDEYYEIQKNELKAMSSIYMDDFTNKTVQKSGWDKFPQIVFEVSLRSVSYTHLDVYKRQIIALIKNGISTIVPIFTYISILCFVLCVIGFIKTLFYILRGVFSRLL